MSGVAAGPRRLGPWRLEFLRLWRTRRWLLLVVGFPVVGAVAPVVAAHLGSILHAVGATAVQPSARIGPSDAMDAYVVVAGNIGVLIALGLAANALAFDHRAGLAAFYRTRMRRACDLVLPRWTVCAGATCAAYLVGTVIAWMEITALFGHVPAGRILLGDLYGTLYLLMGLALVAGAGGLFRRPVTLFGVGLGTLVVLPLPELWKPLESWSPSALGGAPVELLRAGGHGPGHYVGGAVVAVVVTVGLLAFAVRRAGRREM